MPCGMNYRYMAVLGLLVAAQVYAESMAEDDSIIKLDNGVIQVGVDSQKGAAITWLSMKAYPRNCVNVADPGRLIQQSYYAGRILDRTKQGQSKAWSPWSWNPIQGGGVSSWARVLEMKKEEKELLYSETIPKLWDMPDEEAEAVMRQWTRISPDMDNVIVVRCQFQSLRKADDEWGPAVPRHQEIPALYFTRNFADIRSYLGEGRWRRESQPPGPPWGRCNPPLKAMAVFEPDGSGVAIFSPAATQDWNFGPHGSRASDDPRAGPCIHIAPIDMVALERHSIYCYQYWLILGNETEIATRLDQLWLTHSDHRASHKTAVSDSDR
jgi:hypothetical protein